MSFSKPKKVKLKGSVRELQLVQTVSRRGVASVGTEEDRTPRHSRKKSESTTPRNYSSSPVKRLKLEAADEHPLPFSLDDGDLLNKRQTIIFFSLSF
jgi:hypothetical protein